MYMFQQNPTQKVYADHNKKAKNILQQKSIRIFSRCWRWCFATKRPTRRRWKPGCSGTTNSTVTNSGSWKWTPRIAAGSLGISRKSPPMLSNSTGTLPRAMSRFADSINVFWKIRHGICALCKVFLKKFVHRANYCKLVFSKVQNFAQDVWQECFL